MYRLAVHETSLMFIEKTNAGLPTGAPARVIVSGLSGCTGEHRSADTGPNTSFRSRVTTMDYSQLVCQPDFPDTSVKSAGVKRPS